MGSILMRPRNKKKLQLDENTLFKILTMEWMEDRKAVIKETTYLRDLSVFEKDLFPALWRDIKKYLTEKTRITHYISEHKQGLHLSPA